MHLFKLVALLPLIAPLALAASSKDCAYKTKEEVHAPHGWIKHSKPSPDHKISLRIGLPQPNFGVLEQHLYEVSDPDHERYGQHLSKEEVEELVAPHQESLDSVGEWLSTFGFKEKDVTRSPAKDWIAITVPVSLAEKMLDTTYHVWKHVGSGEVLVRTTNYRLPSNLHEHVDVVQPTTSFGRFQPFKSTIVPFDEVPEPLVNSLVEAESFGSAVTVDPSCNRTITISCLQQLYNAVGYVPSNNTKNSIGITGYLEQFANIQDLQTFYAEQRPDAVNSTFEFFSIDGGLNNQTLSEAGIEANLDVQFAFGLSHPIPAIFYSTGGRPPFNPDQTTPTNTNEPYQAWLDFVLTQKNPPLVVSTSYGEPEQTVPESYARRVCASIAQLGARGVSVIFSSGDGGVGDGNPNPATQQCITNDGRNATRFLPTFPASCPFATSVGGTEHIDPEVAVSRFFSGGGFSDYFPRPAYQQAATRKFLSTLPEGLYKDLYNPAGRGFPDVSAQGDRYRIWYQNRPILIGGTSASSPAFAGLVALLNDARFEAKRGPLGFLNPLLYSKGASTFNDVTGGGNPGCGTLGFNATEGWDPVTGLGTPNFGKLKDIVTSRFAL
ncbi:unnamed protein product [Cyclocybe aegerita]|uniref:tripeptidyl-peptidase II n=1 Tax=Cyclocybe aegerita TaxID=1973307 RepID=A0A8S0W2T3_CYCAE|nr:unnamed protein product [Cyclocybe aegerita]